VALGFGAVYLSAILAFIYYGSLSSPPCGLCNRVGRSIPVVFFSDLESGPAKGWEGSTSKGAAVTIWGKNFGSTREKNYITINGAELLNDSDYAEWGASGTAIGIPRGLERITFWLNSSCRDGTGTLSVTVGGATSNTLPFTVRSGNIYFISTNGKDNYNGRYATPGGWSNGPWKTLKMVLTHNNGVIAPGDTIYIRGGTYSQEDRDGALMRARCDYGTLGKPIAIVGYPGEIPLMDMTNIWGTKRGVFSMETGTYNGTYGAWNLGHGADYFVFSKIKATHGAAAFGIWGVGNRIIGSYFKDNNDETWSGVIMVDTSQDIHIYGNYFEHNGYDPYKHDIYIKTHDSSAIGTMTTAKNVYVGWNEFNRWTADLNPITKPSRGGCIEIQTESTAYKKGKLTNNVYIHDNYFHDGDSQALYAFSTRTLVSYNNIFSNITCTAGGILLGDIDNTSAFYNNTFYLIAPPNRPMIQILNGPPYSSVQSKNNIYYAYPGQRFLNVESGNTFNSSHDLYFNSSVPSGYGIFIKNPVVNDPNFLSAGADFHLNLHSPAKDSGTADLGSVVTRDYDGIPRPQGSFFDIGAYEIF
jgi:hypothetical protein